MIFGLRFLRSFGLSVAGVHDDPARVAVVSAFWAFSAALRTQAEQFPKGVGFVLPAHF
jgi:hypothetical protein